MGDVWTNPTIADVRASAPGAPRADREGPGLIDSIAPGFRRARAAEDWGWNQINYEGRATAEMAATLRKKGIFVEPPDDSPAARLARAASGAPDPFWAAVAQHRDLLPDDYAGIGDSASLRRWALDRRRADMAQADRDLQGGSTAGGLVGALGAGMLDPTSYIPVGGEAAHALSFGRRLVTVMGREAAANMGLAAVTEPLVQQDAAALGVHRGASDVVADIATQGLAGAAIGGAAVAIPAALGKALDRVTGNRPDRIALDAAKTAVPDGYRTPDEQAALHVVERADDVAAASPFVEGIAGDSAHAGKLDAMLGALSHEGRPPDYAAPVPPPSPRALGVAGSMERHAAIENIESGGRQFDAHGNVLTSSAGALGVMQLMPSTGPIAARLARLPWDPDRLRTDPDYNRALGHAYYDELLRQFGGDPVKAAAAYNAGPGSAAKGTGVRGAMMRAQRAGEPENWEAYLPAETRDYVQKFRQRTGAAGDVGGYGGAIVTDANAEPLPDIIAPDIAHAAFGTGENGVMAGYLSGEAGMPTFETRSFRPDEIDTDAALMQFKGGGDAQGVTDRLAGVTQWNAAFSGRMMVWEALDGRRLIADGHQRLGLAKRLATEGHDIRLDTMVMREADGITASDARVIAALKNMAEGSGTALDAAKIIRDAGPAVMAHIPPRSAIARDAVPLARLGKDAFGLAVNELVPSDQAAIVGRLVPHNYDQQLALMHLLMQTDPANRTQAEAIVRQGIAAGYIHEEQMDMFGKSGGASSLFLRRAKVLDRGLARLRKLKNVFNVAAIEADTLESIGSNIARDATTREAEANAQAIALVERLAHSEGPIKDALDAATRSFAEHGKIASAVNDFTRALRDLDFNAIIRDSGRPAGEAGAVGDVGAHGAGGDGSGRAGGVDEADAAASGGEPGGLAPASPEAERAVSIAELEAEGQTSMFADPVGSEAKAQAESIEHDLRMRLAADAPLQGGAKTGQAQDGTMGMALFDQADQPEFRLDATGEQTSLPDLLDHLDEDEKAAAIMRACMAPPKGPAT